jgi:hypothetical protein
MILTIRDDMAREFVRNSNDFRLARKKKFVTYMLVRFNAQGDLRIFLREEIGRIQHVVWLSESDLSLWANSSVESHFHLTTPRGSKCRK